MALPADWYDHPHTVVGCSFEITSGLLWLQHGRGTVLEVQEALNAAGKRGHVVIHTLEDGKIYRTPWSYFREHATLHED
jgi:hypothetical protein